MNCYKQYYMVFLLWNLHKTHQMQSLEVRIIHLDIPLRNKASNDSTRGIANFSSAKQSSELIIELRYNSRKKTLNTEKIG